VRVNILRWTQDAGHRRWLLLGAWVLVLAQVGFVAVAVVATARVPGLTFSDRLAEIGDWLVGGTLTLAATAAVVALLAYSAATGLPDLKFQIMFPGCAANQPVLPTVIDGLGVAKVRREPLAIGSIALHNLSSYSARNPVVVIRFNDIGIAENEFSNPRGIWDPLEHGALGIATIQWDGGSNYSIHGQQKRVVPIHFLSLAWRPLEGVPSLTVELLAEGYVRQGIHVPVYFEVLGTETPRPGPPPPEWL
jgi:hypothetical protein